MKDIVVEDLFSMYKADTYDNSVTMSYFQFADDTLLMCEKLWANIKYLKVVLILFEVISGLKSQLVGVNVFSTWLDEASTVLNFKT